MQLARLIKELKDMELLYGNAVVDVNIHGDSTRCFNVVAINGKNGEKRPNECRDPNIVTIFIKEENDGLW